MLVFGALVTLQYFSLHISRSECQRIPSRQLMRLEHAGTEVFWDMSMLCGLVSMQIPVSGLVSGDPLVVGMCGFDIFAGCIVEVCTADNILLIKILLGSSGSVVLHHHHLLGENWLLLFVFRWLMMKAWCHCFIHQRTDCFTLNRYNGMWVLQCRFESL